MSNLEVGMYARLNNCVYDTVVIYKIMEVFENTILTENDMSIYQGEYSKENIIKASYNIIDLIEEGDLLTIEYYSERYSKRVTRIFEVTYKDEEYINLGNAKCQFLIINKEWSNGDKNLKPVIKSIVTKEQFKSIEYEVK